ncbi:zinc finger protein 654 [Amphiprion ocellaris]|uniref:zinc finger protein 654 n=1 Tax=Amphiprion ocellaris TaxID=80972 RepID=UPI0024115D65|nr:zinc finger protein 654 [Amphiprion ocellaris]
MADNESDLETDGLELALDTLCIRHCSDESSLNSKDYCSEFCELVEEYTGQWQVPLPQLKVLRTALSNFTKATTAFPDDCQHIHYVLSSLALSFFELMLFFSKEEFVEEPLKDILDSFQGCHSQLLRHRNIYLQHVKQIMKVGGPWENPVLQGILKEADLPANEVEDFLSSELPVFLELRVRYLQACERMQEAMALAKSCLENREAGKHLYFHQAYLTCLYKTSLHENLHKEMAEIDGRDAVEIICNTESVEKDELLLSLCKAFLTQQLHNGDMYYIWDLVFIWSRLYLRAHPSRQGFLTECLQLASSATNARAIFPFIKLVTTELGGEGVQVCVELCARALQLCDMKADTVTRSLVCKTIAFLLPHDLEICRACALLVFCQERSLEAYRTVCLLYMHPDQEPHPHNSPVRTSVRFHILQRLKERLCFDPEFWNLLTLRTHCLELMSDKVMKAAVLSEMEEEEENEFSEELLTNNCINDSCTQGFNSCHCTAAAFVNQNLPEDQTIDRRARKYVSPSNNAPLKRRKWRRKLRRRKQSISDDELDVCDDPEISYNLESTSWSNKPVYSLRRNHTNMETTPSVKLPLNRKREYLSRCVKSQILKRKGRKKRWLQGLPKLDPVQTVKEKKVKGRGRKRGRKPLPKLELSYPDNEICLTEEESGFEENTDTEDNELDMPHLEREINNQSEQKEIQLEHLNDPERENGEHTGIVCGSSLSEQTQEDSQTHLGYTLCEGPPGELQAAVEANPGLDGPLLELMDCPVELLHNYSLKSKKLDSEKPSESTASEELNGNIEQEPQPTLEAKVPNTAVKKTWKDRVLRTQQYAHLMYHCNICHKDYKGLNVMRHALSHLKSRKLRCILCGKRFKQLPFAKKHILDHIDAMCKQKPHDKEQCSEVTTAANGVIDKVENQRQPQDENQSSVSDNETPEQKPGSKMKVSSLKREERIIRNLRTLIKKTSVLHKKCKNPDMNIFKQVDFKDEQVVIKDGLVIVRDPSVMEKEGEDAGKEMSAGENGYGLDITYHLCPSESCDRVFLRISTTLTKHAIKCHIDEEKVLEKTYVWAKHKCSLCLRQTQFLQHYKDHMKLHNTPLPHFCYHQECNQRFLTQQELKDHVGTHQPFRPQCPFTDCEKLFSSLQGLYDHEWRHYIPAPQKEELELGPNRQIQQSAEAPWKQRVKVEEIWLQNKKGQRDSPTRDVGASNVQDIRGKSKAEGQACEVPDSSQNPSKSDNCSSYEHADESKPAVNGYEDVTRNPTSHTTAAAATTPSKRCRKKAPMEWDPINVRDVEDMSTMAEGVQQNMGEPHITEHKTFKPEDPSYAPFVKAPFIRPPPSTYLDESLLSMRKRRSVDEAAPRKYVYWNHKKKKDPAQEQEQQVVEVAPEQKIRHRCDKCLSSFSSLEELQNHQALNTCSALFGFDSDDES